MRLIGEKRIVLTNVNSIFLLLPDGLGDLVYWLPVLRFFVRKNPSISLFYPFTCKGLDAICGAGGLNTEKVNFVVPDADIKLDLAIVLSDNVKQLNQYQSLIEKAPVRLGLAGGRNRKALLNRIIRQPLLKKRHELQRNLRILRAFEDASEAESVTFEHLHITVPTVECPRVPKRYVVIHPFSHGHGREWPVSYFRELILDLNEQSLDVVVTGSEAEKERIAKAIESFGDMTRVVDLSGKLDVTQLLAVLGNAEAVVAASTGPLHLAAAMGVPTIGIYPPKKGINAERWGPIGRQAYAVHARRCTRNACNNMLCACVEQVRSNDVFDLLLELLNKHELRLTNKTSTDRLALWSWDV
jgi:ADP-heptose:LPS heptosyltransferase